MPISLIPSFIFYCFISGITPGPANLSSLSAALRYGKKTARKQWKGLFTGYAIVAISSVILSYYLGNVLEDNVKYLSYIGAAYLCFLAVATWKESDNPSKQSMHCNFMTGILIQLTNVKIIIFCISTLSIYVLPYSSDFSSLLIIGILLPFTGPIANLAWLYAGVALQKYFHTYKTAINILMSVSLILCALTII